MSDWRRGTESSAGGFSGSMATGNSTSRRLERRWAPRYAFRTDLEIEWGSAVLRGITRDVSSNGMFIESHDTLWVGAGFSARLLFKSDPVKIDCFVRRVEPGRGMGVTVATPEPHNQQRYLELIASLSADSA